MALGREIEVTGSLYFHISTVVPRFHAFGGHIDHIATPSRFRHLTFLTNYIVWLVKHLNL